LSTLFFGTLIMLFMSFYTDHLVRRVGCKRRRCGRKCWGIGGIGGDRIGERREAWRGGGASKVRAPCCSYFLHLVLTSLFFFFFCLFRKEDVWKKKVKGGGGEGEGREAGREHDDPARHTRLGASCPRRHTRMGKRRDRWFDLFSVLFFQLWHCRNNCNLNIT